MKLNEYITQKGEKILYAGHPDLDLLEQLSFGPGDIWHSSLDQGYSDAFKPLMYHTSVFFWYINDFHGLERCISWRMNPHQFAVRKSVWECIGGFNDSYEGIHIRGIDFAFRAIYFSGAVPLFVKGLYEILLADPVQISSNDKYIFFRKNFKFSHSAYLFLRSGLFHPSEWLSFLNAFRNNSKNTIQGYIRPRKLQPIQGTPLVSYIIPTMMRQDFTVQLLQDLARQTFLPSQVIIVDGTPIDQRDESFYANENFPFEVIVRWQSSKGSCRARNEAIGLCNGDYIIFGDDDIRIPSNYIENHISFLQTYNAMACNGLDIRADQATDGLEVLEKKLKALDGSRKIAGVAHTFNNANSCVKREYVSLLGGNDINFDGGYGEDSDFGLSLTKIGVIVLQNPYSANLHLKPAAGGYRFWGLQAKVVGKKRKQQPWELDKPVRWVAPSPSPTVLYGYLKNYNVEQVDEYRFRYLFFYVISGKIWSLPIRLIMLPYKILKFKKSKFYADGLIKLGKRIA